MATQLEIFTTLLDKIHTLSSATNNPDELSNLINQLQSVTTMIRNGYQFSNADLLNLPAVISTQVTDMYNLDKSLWDTLIGSEIASMQLFKDTLSYNDLNDKPYSSMSFLQSDSSRFAVNGVKEHYFSGYAAGSSDFVHIVPVPEDSVIAGIYRVQAIFSHHILSLYGCMVDSHYLFRGVDLIESHTVVPSISSVHCGSFIVDKTSPTSLRIHKTSGTHAGAWGYYYIKVTTINA